MAVERRTLTEPRLFPEGPDDGALPRTFRLDILTHRQRRDGRQRIWLDEQPAGRVTVAGGLTRRQLAGLIQDVADWLAYDGKDG